MTNLTILNTSIRTRETLFSLNDLHRVSGGEERHKPTRFMRLDQTQELIAEIQKDFERPDLVFKITKGRGIQGTYACEELALAYATWISPKFHLVVLRAFIAMHKGEGQSRQLALPEPEVKIAKELTREQWLRFASLWFICYNNLELLGNLWKPLEALGSPFATTAYTHFTEYKMSLGVMQRQLLPLLAEFEVYPHRDRHSHHALRTLREYQPCGLGKLVKI